MISQKMIRFSSLIILLAFIASGGCGGKSEVPTPPAASGMKLVLLDNEAELDGKSLRFPIMYDDLKNIFGKPSRNLQSDSAIVMTWDEYGVYCFLSADGKQVSKLSWTLDQPESSERKDDYAKYWPKKPFQGTITIEGVELTTSMTPEVLNEKIAEQKFKRSATFDFSWQRVYRGQTLSLLTRNKGSKIYEVLVGK